MKPKFDTKAPFLKSIKLEPSESTDFPFSLSIFKNGVDVELHKPLTIICGENGSGKSTFIETIAHICGFNLLGGNQNHVSARGRRDR